MLPNPQAKSPERNLQRVFIYLFDILLPLKDNRGHPHERELFRAVAGELTGRFGGPAHA